MRLSKFTVYQQPYLSTYLFNLPYAQFQLNLSFQTIINHGTIENCSRIELYNLRKKKKNKKEKKIRIITIYSFRLIRIRPVIRYSPFEQRWIPIENSKYHLYATARLNSLSKEDEPGYIYIFSSALPSSAHPLFPILLHLLFRGFVSRSKRGRRPILCLESPMALPMDRGASSRGQNLDGNAGGNHRKRDGNLWRDREEGCGGRKSRPGWDGIWIIESGRSRGRTLNKITWEKRWNKVREREKEMGGPS